MSYFRPDVIILILGPWFGIFYYIVDLWWVSDGIWRVGSVIMFYEFNIKENGDKVLVVLLPISISDKVFLKNV